MRGFFARWSGEANKLQQLTMRGEETEGERGSFCRQRAARSFALLWAAVPGGRLAGQGGALLARGGAWGRAPTGMSPRGASPSLSLPREPGAARGCGQRLRNALDAAAALGTGREARGLREPGPCPAAPRFGSPAAAFRARCHLPSRSDARPRRPWSCVPNSPVLTVSSLSVIPRPPRGPPLSAQGRGLISATPGEALSPPPRPLLGCAVVPAAEVGVSEQVSR